MNAEILKSAGIDYDRGVKRFMGRAYLYEKTLAKFARDTTVSRLRAAYEADDRAGMFAAAHEFKGMCGTIAISGLHETAGALVECLRGEACSWDAIAAAYEKLASEYHTVHAAVLAAMEESI